MRETQGSTEQVHQSGCIILVEYLFRIQEDRVRFSATRPIMNPKLEELMARIAPKGVNVLVGENANQEEVERVVYESLLRAEERMKNIEKLRIEAVN